MMNCEHVEQMMHFVIDQECSEDEYTQVQQHLATCPHCHIKFEQLKVFTARLNQLPTVTLSSSLVDQLIADQVIPAPIVNKRRRFWPTISSAVVAFAACLFMFIYFQTETTSVNEEAASNVAADMDKMSINVEVSTEEPSVAQTKQMGSLSVQSNTLSSPDGQYYAQFTAHQIFIYRQVENEPFIETAIFEMLDNFQWSEDSQTFHFAVHDSREGLQYGQIHVQTQEIELKDEQ